MIKVENSIVINRPVEEVFAYIATDFFATAPAWFPSLSKVKADGPVSVGATAVGHGKPYAWKLQILEYELNRKFAWTAIAKVIQNTNTLTFESVTEGTKVTCASTGQPIGLWQLAEALMTGSVERGNVCAVNNLKDRLERTKALPAE
jgi:uncharacterized membrane protein